MDHVVESLVRFLLGDELGSPSLNKTALISTLSHLTGEQIELLVNITGTSNSEELFQLFIMRVKGYERSFMQFPEYRMTKILFLYVSPVLLLLGTLGNLFSLFILRRKPMLKVSSYMYLAFLSVIDTMVLYVGLLRIWINELTGFDYQTYGNWICKLSVAFGYVASDLSVWLIIAVTVERYIVVCFPFKANSMCNVSRAKKVIAFIFLLMLALNLHFFWTAEIVTNGSLTRCEAGEPFRHLVEEIWPWVDAFVYSFFPFVTIMILNILIIREVAGARSKRVLLSGNENERMVSSPSPPLTQASGKGRVNNNEGSRLTALLLTVSFTFLLLTLPNNISLIVIRFWNKRYENDDKLSEQDNALYHRMAKFTLVKAITELLMYTNHSINFFLYCATGNKFRRQIVELFTCAGRRNQVLAKHETIASLRGTSQSVVGDGTHDSMMKKLPLRRSSSCLSSTDLTALEGTDDSLNGVAGYPAWDDSRDGVCENCERNVQIEDETYRGETRKRKSAKDNGNGSLRSKKNKNVKIVKDAKRKKGRESPTTQCGCLATRSRSQKQDGYHSSPETGRSKKDSRKSNGLTWNGSGFKVYYSSKKQRPVSSTSLRRSFDSSDNTPNDSEYIALKPTIHWCESLKKS